MANLRLCGCNRSLCGIMLSALSFDLQWGTAFDVLIISPNKAQKKKKKKTKHWGTESCIGASLEMWAAECLANPGGCLFFCGCLSSRLSLKTHDLRWILVTLHTNPIQTILIFMFKSCLVHPHALMIHVTADFPDNWSTLVLQGVPGRTRNRSAALTDSKVHTVLQKQLQLHRKAESKPLRDDHKRCNREPEFSTIQLNQQPLSWVRSRGQKRERVWKGKDLREGANERRSRSESRLNSQIKEEWVSQRCIHSSKVTNHPQLLLRA